MLNLDEFKELFKANNKAAVFCFASWSASCRKIEHIIYHLAGEYTGFLIIKVDIDDHEVSISETKDSLIINISL
jgi:thiol-disulfide isomerase/thioredoxin